MYTILDRGSPLGYQMNKVEGEKTFENDALLLNTKIFIKFLKMYSQSEKKHHFFFLFKIPYIL